MALFGAVLAPKPAAHERGQGTGDRPQHFPHTRWVASGDPRHRKQPAGDKGTGQRSDERPDHSPTEAVGNEHGEVPEREPDDHPYKDAHLEVSLADSREISMGSEPHTRKGLTPFVLPRGA